VDIIFETWNVRSLYGAGSLKTLSHGNTAGRYGLDAYG